MGNVQHRGKPDRLSKFQREKLKHEFFTFFDLNNDGCLTYKDFLWAKDKICYMSGWKIDSPKYKITEALFHEIWESLEIIADVDKDGKITKTEWLMMWKTYKKEITEREKEEKDFLKKYYHHTHKEHNGSSNAVDDAKENVEEEIDKSKENLYDEPADYQENYADDDDYPVQLDSDEEPMSIVARGGRGKAGKKNEEAPDDNQSHQSRLGAISQENGVEAKDEAVKEDIAELTILEQFAADTSNFEQDAYCKLPKWLYKYLVFRFNLLDRVGDGIIDHEEFEYVLSEFGVSERTARQAFNMCTMNNTKELDFDYFVSLFEEYYLSDVPSGLGNFINGRLEFPVEEGSDAEANEDEVDIEDVDPGLVDHRINSSTSLHSMDDDLHPEIDLENGKKHHNTNQESSHEVGLVSSMKKMLKKGRETCCII